MKNNKGITLIALVITVIVLLILAGISINMLSGDNGVLKKVAEGKEKMEISKTEEQKRIGEYEVNMPYPVIEVETEAKQDSVVKNEKPSNKNPIIPKGFKAINEGNAIWGSNDGYKYGLVIEDVVDGEYTKGSQFVWVPVENYEDFHAIEGFYNNNKRDTYLGKAPDYKDRTLEAGESELDGKPTINNVKGTAESIEMYRNVYKYKGFYIARFEAGLSGEQANSTLEEKTVANGNIKPLSIIGKGVWNYIQWGGNDDQTASDGLKGNDSADGAVKVARSMYNSSKYGVKSTLCYGVQWDAMLNFLDSRYVTNSFSDALKEGDIDMVRQNIKKGYYSATAVSPAITGQYASKNIYDVEGNVFELTMEQGVFGNNTDILISRVSRGGGYNNRKPSSIRIVRTTDFVDETIGFRVALIIE